jgi:spore germination protein KB
MEQISPLQMAYLLVIQRAVIMLALLPVVTYTPGGRDGWLASVLGTMLGMIPTWLGWKVTRLLPGQDLAQICEACLGKVVGKAVTVLYLGFFAMNAAVVLRQFSDFLTTAPMPETPTEFFLGLAALAAVYAIRQGIEVTARVTELLLPPLVLFVLAVLALGIKDMDITRLKPYVEHGWGAVFVGAATAASLWAESLIITMLAPLISNSRLMLRYALTAVLFAGFWLTLSALAAITFFSAPEAQVQMFPLYSLMRTVSLGDFLERMDPLFLGAWTIGSFIKLALLSYVSCKLLARILGLAEYRSLAFPMAFLGSVVALQQFQSVVSLRAFNDPRVLSILLLPFGILFPVLLLIAGRLRGLGGIES